MGFFDVVTAAKTAYGIYRGLKGRDDGGVDRDGIRGEALRDRYGAYYGRLLRSYANLNPGLATRLDRAGLRKNYALREAKFDGFGYTDLYPSIKEAVIGEVGAVLGDAVEGDPEPSDSDPSQNKEPVTPYGDIR